jgi:hypothetical protein
MLGAQPKEPFSRRYWIDTTAMLASLALLSRLC